MNTVSMNATRSGQWDEPSDCSTPRGWHKLVNYLDYTPFYPRARRAGAAGMEHLLDAPSVVHAVRYRLGVNDAAWFATIAEARAFIEGHKVQA